MTVPSANRDQAEHWSGVEGDHWVQYADHHDSMLVPFADAVFASARLVAGERVLDVACGCGATTIRSAQAVGEQGRATGIDLSPQMIELAGQRADNAGLRNIEFKVADAQTTDMADPSNDIAISRFGVMFFDDPTAAFTNIGRTLRPGGRFVFCCWQRLEDNDWMFVPGVAAAEHVDLPDMSDSSNAGPFSLADTDRIEKLLLDAGFAAVGVEGLTTTVLLGGGGTTDETIDYLVQSGAGRALFAGAEPDDQQAAIEAVRRTLEPLHDGDGVRLGAQAWIVTAAWGDDQP